MTDHPDDTDGVTKATRELRGLEYSTIDTYWLRMAVIPVTRTSV